MKRKKRPAGKYPPPLNRPSAPTAKISNVLATKPVIDPGFMDLSTAHVRHGLELLCKHYGISSDMDPGARDRVLMLRLCLEHVPYFRERSQKSKQWDLTRQAWLVHDVIEARGLNKKGRKPTRTVLGACKFLVDSRRYRGSADSLESRYKEAIRPKSPLWVVRQSFSDDMAFLEALKKSLPARSGTK